MELFEVLLLGGSSVIHLNAQILEVGRLLINSSDLAIPDLQRALHALDLVLQACDGLCIFIDLATELLTDLVGLRFGDLKTILVLLVSNFKLILRLVLHFALLVLKRHDFAMGALCVKDDGLSDALLERYDSLASCSDRRRYVEPLIVFN